VTHALVPIKIGGTDRSEGEDTVGETLLMGEAPSAIGRFMWIVPQYLPSIEQCSRRLVVDEWFWGLH
jgi:hypothetical protein